MGEARSHQSQAPPGLATATYTAVIYDGEGLRLQPVALEHGHTGSKGPLRPGTDVEDRPQHAEARAASGGASP
eukprot:9030840-Lingulodinium_polyedra.AAC.1